MQIFAEESGQRVSSDNMWTQFGPVRFGQIVCVEVWKLIGLPIFLDNIWDPSEVVPRMCLICVRKFFRSDKNLPQNVSNLCTDIRLRRQKFAAENWKKITKTKAETCRLVAKKIQVADQYKICAR